MNLLLRSVLMANGMTLTLNKPSKIMLAFCIAYNLTRWASYKYALVLSSKLAAFVQLFYL